MRRADLTRAIYEGEAGPRIGAFFDLDRTLLAGFSSVAFFRDRLMSGLMAPREFVDLLMAAASFQLGRIGFSGLVSGFAAALRGMSEAAMDEAGERIFVEQLAREIYPEARLLIHAHRRMEHTLAIISSATRFQVDPLARELGIPHVLCTQLEVQDGTFTGRVVRPTCYGEGKAIAARELSILSGIDLGRSHFYTDSDEDLPLLEIVGHPRPTNPNRRLSAIAAERRWPVISFSSRGAPGLEEVLRTGLAAGSFVPSFLLGLPAALMNQTRREAVNVGLSAWGELGTALAGVALHVKGESNLWAHRPAIFIFNHHSPLDPLLLCRLLRRDFLWLGGSGVQWRSWGMPWLQLAGAIQIPAFERASSSAQLEPARKALREGLSLVCAPEGPGPRDRMGRFGPGAFQLAKEAEVPIVPIVLRNATDALPDHGWIVRPANVEVEVHAPISTQEWTDAALEPEIEKVYRLYVDSLS